MSAANPAPANRIARATFTVMLAFLFSQLAGLAAKILIGAAFPAGFDLDAFYTANRPSETLVTIMAGGILVSSFIPVFVRFLVNEDRPGAWRLASASANLILLILSVLAVGVVLLAGPIVRYALGAGFSPEKQALTIELLRIQAISIVFFGLSGLLVGILNSHQKFLMSALAPAMYNFGQILGVVLLAPRLGIYGLAWGVVFGALLNLLIQVPPLLRLGGRYRLTLGRHDPAVGEVFRLMAPRMFGAAVVQLMIWVNNLLASHMDPGSVYALGLGFSLMMIAWAAIAQSVATAAMPTFSRQYAEGKLDEIRQTLAATLRGVILLSLPAAAGLILLRTPFVAMLFQYRSFTAGTTALVAWALAWYASGLVFHSLLEILVRAYYAMHDTRTPVLVGAAAMTLSIGLSLVLPSLFERIGWMPHGGLALAVSIATALEVTTLWLLLRRRLGGLHARGIARGAGSALLGTAAMTALLLFWLSRTDGRSVFLIGLGGMALGGLAYGIVLILLRVPEVYGLISLIRRKLPIKSEPR